MKKIIYSIPLIIVAFYNNSIIAQTVPQHDHVVIVVMENHSSTSIIGSANAPYINSLINGTSAANFTQSFGLTHPSQPNYIMLFSGSNQGVTNDSDPSTFPFTTPNLGASLLSNSYTFIGYSEDLPSVGFNGTTSSNYARKHSPWINWQDAPTNGIPSINNQPFSSFPTDFSTLPTVSFVIPNLAHDMHDPIILPSAIVNGDAWLQTNLDAYIQWAKTNNSLFILTFDEDDGINVGGISTSTNHITTFFIGENVLQGQYSETIDHYTILRTLEDMYGLPYAGNSSSSIPITDCWIAVSTEIKDVEKIENFSFFPNPTSEGLTIDFHSISNQNVTIIVTDLLSKTLVNINKEVIAGNNRIQLPVKNFTSGTYFVNVVSSEINVVKKVVVKK
ncbi:MAG: alkaline phosphatase family protein [Bacteroidota bacterium]